MNPYVLDTSVTIAWYLQESFSTSARKWQERLLSGKISLIVPTPHLWEFANAMRTLVQRKEITKALAYDTYELHLQAPLEIVEPNPESVLEIATDYGATAYDAVYISLSLSRDIPLITAEKTTTSWVTRLGNHVEPVR